WGFAIRGLPPSDPVHRHPQVAIALLFLCDREFDQSPVVLNKADDFKKIPVHMLFEDIACDVVAIGSDQVFVGFRGGEHKDHGMGQQRVGAQGLQKLEAVHAWHIEV
ncbi:conserved hypothetical protein, partial [Ricinus communis]